MKNTLAILTFVLAPGLAAAEGSHAGGHDMSIGAPATTKPARTVEIAMREDYEGDNIYIFDQKELSFAAGETVRLHIVNEGEEIHEFVMDTAEANAEHKEIMTKFPEMEHDDPNAVRLEPGEKAEIIWTFGEPGVFEFACLLPGHYENGMHGPITVN